MHVRFWGPDCGFGTASRGNASPPHHTSHRHVYRALTASSFSFRPRQSRTEQSTQNRQQLKYSEVTQKKALLSK